MRYFSWLFLTRFLIIPSCLGMLLVMRIMRHTWTKLQSWAHWYGQRILATRAMLPVELLLDMGPCWEGVLLSPFAAVESSALCDEPGRRPTFSLGPFLPYAINIITNTNTITIISSSIELCRFHSWWRQCLLSPRPSALFNLIAVDSLA